MHFRLPKLQGPWAVWLMPASWVAIAALVILFGGRPLRGQAPNPEMQPDVVAGALISGQSVGQTFVPEMGGLHRLDVYLSTQGQSPTGTVVFHLKRSPDDLTDLATVRVPAGKIQDNQFHAFEFPALPADSRGKSVYWSLELRDSLPGQVISVWGYAADLYPAGQARLSPVTGAVVADLVFRLYYSPTPFERLAVELGRLAENKPFLLGQPAWYAGLGIVYLGLLFGLGWYLGREARDGDSPKHG